ncbi:MAG: aspartyl protease family protein [Spirochaetaceae bacterium]|jgi:clan AA aspartic protease|nr:aspartyl protease family protein [Spirochaetaceae bacterium]
MGITRDEITLTNIKDDVRVQAGLLNKIRSVTVTAVADTGALRLTIPESIRKKLGLEIVQKVSATLADGEKLEIGLSEGVEVRWKNRAEITQAWVVPKECSVLLGAMPMEGMDIMVDPKKQRLVGIHGDEQLGILY